jgi:hypothetical protein
MKVIKNGRNLIGMTALVLMMKESLVIYFLQELSLPCHSLSITDYFHYFTYFPSCGKTLSTLSFPIFPFFSSGRLRESK